MSWRQPALLSPFVALVAGAAAAPASAATVTVLPARSAAGSKVAVSASGFRARAPFSVRRGAHRLALRRTDRNGRLLLLFFVPRATPVGPLLLTIGTHRLRIPVTIRVLLRGQSRTTSLTAGSGAPRALLSPVVALSAAARVVYSWGWRARSQVALSVAGARLGSARATRGGYVSFRLPLLSSAGTHQFVLTAPGRRLAVPFATSRSTPAPTPTPTPVPIPTPTPTPTPVPTPPPPAPDIVVGAAGDIACAADVASTPTTCQQQATSDLVSGMNPDAVLPLGDTQYQNGELSNFQDVYGPSWGRFNAFAYPVPGDNEYGSGTADGYFQYFGARAGDASKGYYAFSLGNWRVYALNTNDNCLRVSCSAGSAQETWLRQDLADHPATCQLAYWHQPLFNSGFAGSFTKIKAIWADLQAAGVELVLNGHDHHYERFARQAAGGAPDSAGPREFIVGTGGKSHAKVPTNVADNSQVANYDTFGALRLTLRNTGYDWKFIAEAGKTFTDSGSESCH